MAERHDNTKPAEGGLFSLSPLGSFQYFPIVEGRGTQPLVALSLHERLDGTIVSTIHMKFAGPIGELDE